MAKIRTNGNESRVIAQAYDLGLLNLLCHTMKGEDLVNGDKT